VKRIRKIQQLLIAFAMALTFTTNAQELQRKASLGVYLEPMSDSISEAQHTDKGKGVLIPNVQPNSTASKAGIVANCVLLNINDKETNSIQDVLQEVQDLRGGDQVKLTYSKDRKVFSKKVKAVPRPIETSDVADIIMDKWIMRGINCALFCTLQKV
jgi:S1-C subfamily serine protease